MKFVLSVLNEIKPLPTQPFREYLLDSAERRLNFSLLIHAESTCMLKRSQVLLL